MTDGTHRCDETCVCPIHKTALYWSVSKQLHACQDPGCVFAQGLETAPCACGHLYRGHVDGGDCFRCRVASGFGWKALPRCPKFTPADAETTRVEGTCHFGDRTKTFDIQLPNGADPDEWGRILAVAVRETTRVGGLRPGGAV